MINIRLAKPGEKKHPGLMKPSNDIFSLTPIVLSGEKQALQIFLATLYCEACTIMQWIFLFPVAGTGWLFHIEGDHSTRKPVPECSEPRLIFSHDNKLKPRVTHMHTPWLTFGYLHTSLFSRGLRSGSFQTVNVC